MRGEPIIDKFPNKLCILVRISEIENEALAILLSLTNGFLVVLKLRS